MNINELTIGQAKELAALFSGTQHASCAPKNMGQNIAVLDRGFVYVGDVEDQGEWMVITKCKNIRVWGTKNGLGELRNGPTASTIQDEVGEVKFTKKSLIHLIPCKGF